MRLIIICLAGLLLLIQYPLWLGKGGWLRVWDLDHQVTLARQRIDALKARNAKLGSEVQDLKEGVGAIEERARSELGMIKQDEIFIRVLPAPQPQPQVPASALAPAPASETTSETTSAGVASSMPPH
jgi:cell division protein FtsB